MLPPGKRLVPAMRVKRGRVRMGECRLDADLAEWVKANGGQANVIAAARHLTELDAVMREADRVKAGLNKTTRLMNRKLPPGTPEGKPEVSDEQLSTYYKALGCGVITVAAQMAGLRPASVQLWLARGLSEPNEKDWYVQFRLETYKMLGAVHGNLLSKEIAAANNDPKVARQLRQDLFPDTWVDVAHAYRVAGGYGNGGDAANVTNNTAVMVAGAAAGALAAGGGGIAPEVVAAVNRIPPGERLQLRDYVLARQKALAGEPVIGGPQPGEEVVENV